MSRQPGQKQPNKPSAPTPDERIELRLVAGEQTWEQVDEETLPLAEAQRAVPLLWLALFDYDEAEVQSHGGRDVFAAVTQVQAACERAEVLEQQLPEEPSILRESARTLAHELGEAPADQQLALHTEGAFHTLRPEETRSYLEQMFELCSLWQMLREGRDWPEVHRQLERRFSDVLIVVEKKEPRVSGYYLVGSLVEKLGSLEPYRVLEGQGQDDLKPEALAVGEMGLLLGRFRGKWKLMSSGTSANLKGVWGDSKGTTAYLVGEQGALVRLRRGQCRTVEIPTKVQLNAIWGLDPKFICAVGEAGTILAYDGSGWQPWPVPTRASLHAISGTGPDNICVAGQEMVLYRFDGYAWNQMALPEESMVNALCATNGTLLAAGGSRRGGELYRLERGGWSRSPGVPRTDWLDGIWNGWGEEVGLMGGAAVVVHTPGGWVSEALPADWVTAVASGADVMAVGQSRDHEVILRRADHGWEVEASLSGLRLNQIWVAGRPKPPPLKLEAQQPQGSGEQASHA